MGMGFLLLVAAIAASQDEHKVNITEQVFLGAAVEDVRVRAVLDEPLVLARAAGARARVLSNPEVGFTREVLNGVPQQDTWSLSWAPPLDGRHRVRDRAGRAGLSAAEKRNEEALIHLRTELRQAFAEWSLAHERVVVARRLATLVDRLARRADAQAAGGESSVLAARRLLLARVEVRAEVASLAADLAQAHSRVRTWMPSLAPDAVPLRPPLPPPLADTLSWSSSPHLAALAYEVQQTEASAVLANRFWPLPELSIGHQTVRGDLSDVSGPVFGVRWSLPLLDRNQGDRIETRGRLKAARARHELAQARAREQFGAAVFAYVTLRESAVAAAEAESTAAQVLASASAMFEAGESDVTDLLETLRGVLSGHLAALESYGAALRAHRDLEVAAGRPLPLTKGDE